MKRRMNRTITILLTMIMLVMLSGCNAAGEAPEPDGGNMKKSDEKEVRCGGTVNNTDYNAPKEIKSDKLTAFSVNFFRYGEFGREGDANYFFKIDKDDAGRLMLYASWDENTDKCCEVDESVLDGVQKIIKKYDLAQANGVDKKTYGLASEFDTSTFYALYDSGETIKFSENNNPDSEWTGELLDYLAPIFAEHGINDFMPPADTQEMTRFELKFTDGDVYYEFGEIMVPKEKIDRSLEDIATNGVDESQYDTRFRRYIWNRVDEEEVENVYAVLEPELYEKLQTIVKETGLKKYDYDDMSSGFQDDGKVQFYEFYIEYAYGNKLIGSSDNQETFEELKPVFIQFKECIDEYIAANPVEK